jgi:hypothetical protein
MPSFRALVEQLQRRIVDASQQRKRAADTDAAGCTSRGPTKDWTCVQLLRLLQQYPAGVTAAVMETELLSQWRSQVRAALDRCNGEERQHMEITAAPETAGLLVSYRI